MIAGRAIRPPLIDPQQVAQCVICVVGPQSRRAPDTCAPIRFQNPRQPALGIVGTPPAITNFVVRIDHIAVERPSLGGIVGIQLDSQSPDCIVYIFGPTVRRLRGVAMRIR